MSIRRVGGGLPAQSAALEQIRSANNRPVDPVRRHLAGELGEEQQELQEMGLLGNGLHTGYREKKHDPQQQAAMRLRAKLQADSYEDTKAPLVDLHGDSVHFDEDSERTPPTGMRLGDLVPGGVANLDIDFQALEEDLVEEEEEQQQHRHGGSQSEEEGFFAQLDDVGPELDEEEPLPFEAAGDFFAALEDVPEEPRESLMRLTPAPPVGEEALPYDSGEPVEAVGEEDVVEEQPAAGMLPWGEPSASSEPPAELEAAPLQAWPEPVAAAPSLALPAASSLPAATGLLADDWGAFVPMPEDVPAPAEPAAEGSKPPVGS